MLACFCVPLQLLLEFGLLSRSLNVLEDFFTACLALVELAVFQSKNRFRESSKSRMLRRTYELMKVFQVDR